MEFIQPTPEIQKVIDEVSELSLWFAKYDIQCAQYARCQRLGIAYDKNIEELDILAETKAARLKELRAVLEEASVS